jgi:hypothetical protein
LVILESDMETTAFPGGGRDGSRRQTHRKNDIKTYCNIKREKSQAFGPK